MYLMIVPAASIALLRSASLSALMQQRVPELLLVDPERLHERRERDPADAPRRARAHEAELLARQRLPGRDAAQQRLVVQRDVLAHVVDERRVDDRAVLGDLGADPVQPAVDDRVAARAERVDQAGERVRRVGEVDRGHAGFPLAIIRGRRHRPHAAISRGIAISAGITIARLSSLPLALRGSAGANQTRRGYLDSATRSRA